MSKIITEQERIKKAVGKNGKRKDLIKIVDKHQQLMMKIFGEHKKYEEMQKREKLLNLSRRLDRLEKNLGDEGDFIEHNGAQYESPSNSKGNNILMMRKNPNFVGKIL